jgi:signal transduction histidine kinase
MMMGNNGIGNGKVNILMVDDQPARLVSYEAILQGLNENFIRAYSAKEALAQLLKHDIALVLLDVSMPEMDGFELANLIRQHPRYQHTAIIFISGVHLTDLDRIEGYHRGAVDYVSVPVVPEILRAKVGVFVELYRKTRELEMVNVELRTAEENLRRLAGLVLQAQDAERRRVARDLHDGLGQYLVGIKMGVDHLAMRFESEPSVGEQFRDVSGLLNRAISETRTISHLLHPPLLDEIGLESALSTFALGFAKRSGLSVEVNVSKDLGRLEGDVETALFRTAQECLLNVHRHSNSTVASVSLSRVDGHVMLEVRDEGKGMDPIEENDPSRFGVGLFGIRERIRQLKGRLDIVSAPGQGTKIIASIPEPAEGAAKMPLPQVAGD